MGGGVPRIRDTLVGGPYNEDYCILGSTLGSFCLGKLSYISQKGSQAPRASPRAHGSASPFPGEPFCDALLQELMARAVRLVFLDCTIFRVKCSKISTHFRRRSVFVKAHEIISNTFGDIKSFVVMPSLETSLRQVHLPKVSLCELTGGHKFYC